MTHVERRVAELAEGKALLGVIPKLRFRERVDVDLGRLRPRPPRVSRSKDRSLPRILRHSDEVIEDRNDAEWQRFEPRFRAWQAKYAL